MADAEVFCPRADDGSVSNSVASARDDTQGVKLHCVARPLIFYRGEKGFGYELLFPDDMENAFHDGDADVASRSTLDSSLLVGLDVLCDGRRAFLNCTCNTLIGGLVTLPPSPSTVVEILETVSVDTEVVNACQRLKEAGYLIVLDNFISDDPRAPLGRNGRHP